MKAKNVSKFVLISLLIAGAGMSQSPSVSFAENADDRSYPPIMMILVDTSLSMGNRRDPHSNMYSAINAIVGDGTTAGVLPSYQYEVKFGFAGMAYGENGLYGTRMITNDDGLQEGTIISALYKQKYRSGIVATQGYKMNLEWCEDYYTEADIKDCIDGPSTSKNGNYWGVGYYTKTNNQNDAQFKACANPNVYWNNGTDKVKEPNDPASGKYFKHKCARGFDNHEVGTTYVGTRLVQGPECMPGKFHPQYSCRTWCTKYQTGCAIWNTQRVCNVIKAGTCTKNDYRWHCKDLVCPNRCTAYDYEYDTCTGKECMETALRDSTECKIYYAGCKEWGPDQVVTDNCPGYHDPGECKNRVNQTDCKEFACAETYTDAQGNTQCRKWNTNNCVEKMKCTKYGCLKSFVDEHGETKCKIWDSNTCLAREKRSNVCVEKYGPNVCLPPTTTTIKGECVKLYDLNKECEEYYKESYCSKHHVAGTQKCNERKIPYNYCCGNINQNCDKDTTLWERRYECVEWARTDIETNCRNENTTCKKEYGTGEGQEKLCIQTTETPQPDDSECRTWWDLPKCDEYEKIPEEYTYVAGPYTYKPTCAEFACSDYHKENNQAVARLLYPTVSDDVEDIYNANTNINYYVNRYSGFADTPIGPALADLWYLFGCQSGTDCLAKDADPGLIKQKINGVVMEDTHYQCRKKAAILVTDGEPCCNYPLDPNGNAEKQSTAGLWFEDEPDNVSLNTHGHYSVDSYDEEKNAWIDAYHLYKAGIPVYSVAYAMEGLNPSQSGNAGELLNKIALYGGTCKDPETMLLLDPEDGVGPGSDYYKMVSEGTKLDENGVEVEKTLSDRICFYNANDGDALRRALVTALSDMLQSTVTKTKVATTTAIGLANNTEANGTFNNGYYNVYSGYVLTNGPIRKTKLERTAITCNHNTGNFEYDETQYMDMAQRLACRLSDNCMISVKDERTGFYESIADTETRLALSGREGCSNRGDDSVRDFTLKNNCLKQRYIFAGSYGSDRFALYPAITSLASENKAIGYVKDAIRTMDSSGNESLRAAAFLTNNENKAQECASDMGLQYGRPIVSTTTPCTTVADCGTYSNPACVNGFCETYGSTVNYVLSPYECVQDVDCGMKGGVPNRCDFGRCVSNSKFYSPLVAGDESVRIGGQDRKKYGECTTHRDCEQNDGNTYVCHAGKCLPGTVKSCDIRQFMATIPLGTVEYASPVPVAPPRRSYNSRSYKEFSKAYWLRDTMMLVGSNDGMLHAFVLGDNMESKGYTKTNGRYAVSDQLKDGVDSNNLPVIEEGDELWSFIPKGVFTKLHDLLNFGPQNMVNATPVVADVQAPEPVKYKRYANSNSRTTADTQWRTVAVGGFGGSARGYYALDITDPAKPQVLWEIDHQFTLGNNVDDYPSMVDATKLSDSDKDTNFLKNPDAVITADVDKSNRIKLRNGQGYPFLLMGYSSSEPVITQMITDDEGTVEPVVILAGGTTHSTDLTDAEFNRLHRDENDRVGKALYIVRLFPPENDPSKLLVKAFYFDERISGSPAVYPSNFNSVAQVIYVGDEKGALYRLSLTGMDQDKWGSYEKVNFEAGFKNEKPAFDPLKGICNKLGVTASNCAFDAISFKPAVSLYNRTVSGATVQVTFGTGRNTNLNTNDGIYNYVANFYDTMVYDEDAHESRYKFNQFGENGNNPKAQIYLFRKSSSDSISGNDVSDTSEGYGRYSILTSDPGSGGTTLAARQKMTGAPITYDYVSYFPAYTTSDDKNECLAGTASIWRIDGGDNAKTYAGGVNALTNVQNRENNDVFTGNKIDLPEGAKVYGLEITNQMFCRNDHGDSKVAAPQLIFQTGTEFADAASDSGSKMMRGTNKDNKLPSIQSSAMNLIALQPTTSVISWASVYE